MMAGARGSDQFTDYFDGQNEPGLYQVRPIEPALEYTCDIFLVHGLNGGPTKTWQRSAKNGRGTIWFRDHLPSLVKDETRGTNARIWTFGYSANVLSAVSNSIDLCDFGRSLLESVRQARIGYENHKIIWIAHSMGGLVVKMALIEAKLDSLYTPIFEATSGIVFLATPHKGSTVANLGSIAANAVRYSGMMSINTRLLQRLKKHNDYLLEKSHWFSRICAGFKIYTFFETMKTNGVMVVPKDSAVIGISNETSMPLSGDHRSIAQMENFGSGDNQLFRRAVGELVAETASLADPSSDLVLDASNRIPEGFVRCVIRSRNGTRQFTAIYPESTTIRSLCESNMPKRWYRPNTIVGLRRPLETNQIPWYTESIPAVTTSSPSKYDVDGELKINMREPVLVFFSKVRNKEKSKTDVASTNKSMPGSSYKVQLAHVYPDLSVSAHTPRVRHNKKLHAELGAFRADELSPRHSTPNFPCIHINDSLAISLHRTVRIPDDGGSYPAPTSLGALPILSMAQLQDKLPADAVEKGGVVVPLHESEAMRINFHVYGTDMFSKAPKYAIRVFAGGVNGVSGEPVKANMATILKRMNGIERMQDYLYVRGGPEPAQQWLDGIAAAPGLVRQFVTIPHLSPESIEAQATGSAGVGGIQIEVIPQYQLERFYLMRRDHRPPEVRFAGHKALREYPAAKALESPSELGIPLDTRIYARERAGPSRERTLRDELDWASTSNRLRRTVELEQWPPSSSTGDFKVSVRCPKSSQKAPRGDLVLSVFPETTLAFITIQVTHALGLPHEPWSISIADRSLNVPTTDCWRFLGDTGSGIDQNMTISDANISRGQLLFLVPDMMVGGGTQSQYSPLLDVGAGARIRQRIVPDEEDPRSWDTDSACLINAQIIDAELLSGIMGIRLPFSAPSPISFDTYLERNIPFPPESTGPAAELRYNTLAQIKPSSDGIPTDGGDGGTARSLPGYCDRCVINWASYRVRPCRHLLCANCSVDSVRPDLYRTPIHKTDCVVCSSKVLAVAQRKREQITVADPEAGDRDPFESAVPLPFRAEPQIEGVLDVPELADIPIRELQGHRIPGDFPHDQPADQDGDDERCFIM